MVSLPHEPDHGLLELLWLGMGMSMVSVTEAPNGFRVECGSHPVSFEQVMADLGCLATLRHDADGVLGNGDLLDQFIAIVFGF